MMTYAVVVGLTLNFFGAMWLLGATIRRSEVSRFRYTLWQTRDDLVDAIGADRLTASPTTLDLIEDIEDTIAFSELATPFRLVIGAHIMKKSGWVPDPQRDYSGHPEDHQVLLNAAEHRLKHAKIRLTAFGSPSGWLILACLILATPVLILRQGAGVERAADSWRRRYGSAAEVARFVPGALADDRAYC